jgi:hypothetical protein
MASNRSGVASIGWSINPPTAGVIDRAAANGRGHREGKRAVSLVTGVGPMPYRDQDECHCRHPFDRLAGDDRGEASGTIDGDAALAISAPAAPHRGNGDLFADTATRARLARSAGRRACRRDQRVHPVAPAARACNSAIPPKWRMFSLT